MLSTAEIPQFVRNDTEFDASGLRVGAHPQFEPGIGQEATCCFSEPTPPHSAFRGGHAAIDLHPLLGRAVLGFRSLARFEENREIRFPGMGGNGKDQSGKNDGSHGHKDIPAQGGVQ